MSKLIIYYCKSLKSTGKPIIISNGKAEINTDDIILEGINGSITFNNTNDKAKRRGVRASLEIEIEE